MGRERKGRPRSPRIAKGIEEQAGHEGAVAAHREERRRAGRT